MLTEWFDTNCGVKQGDTLSPIIFCIFNNDIVEDVKSVNIGINVMLMILFCLVKLKKGYKKWQKLLDKVYEWSKKWKIKFNAQKSNILHVRQPHVPRTDYSLCLLINIQFK